MSELAALLKSVGVPPHAIDDADIERAHAHMERGDDPVTALARAAIMHALQDGHATLDEVEDHFGEEALENVYGGRTSENGKADQDEDRDGQDAEAEIGDEQAGERVSGAREADKSGEAIENPRHGVDEADEDGGGTEVAETADDAATSETPEIDIGAVAERLAALSEELGLIARNLRAVPIAEPEPTRGDGSRSSPVVVENADDIARAGERVADPSEAQKSAGNYQMAHLRYDGLDLTIETPEGGKRSGTGPNGVTWEVVMPCHYGYCKRSVGADGDHVDVFIGGPPTGKVFVIDQRDLDAGGFDEHKAVLGVDSEEAARALYEKAFSDGKGANRIGAITELSTDEFKNWIAEGDMSQPLGQPADLLQLIASKGGLRPTPEIRALGIQNKRIEVPGEGWRSLFRRAGMTLDEAADAMVATGHLPRGSGQSVLSLLREHTAVR